MVHIEPRKNVLDRADFTASTRQQELDHTDHTDQDSYYLPRKIKITTWESMICRVCELFRQARVCRALVSVFFLTFYQHGLREKLEPTTASNSSMMRCCVLRSNDWS